VNEKFVSLVEVFASSGGSLVNRRVVGRRGGVLVKYAGGMPGNGLERPQKESGGGWPPGEKV